jgi:hypothetical protein
MAAIGADTKAAMIPVMTPAAATHSPARSRRRYVKPATTTAAMIAITIAAVYTQSG